MRQEKAKTGMEKKTSAYGAPTWTPAVRSAHNT